MAKLSFGVFERWATGPTDLSAVTLAKRICGAPDRSLRRECLDHVVVFSEQHRAVTR
jgi:hypothetical protein